MLNKKNIVCFVLSLSLITQLFPSRNPSRYFPFLEKPEEYVTKRKSYVYPSLFLTTASTAFKRHGGNTGIPELWGRYDLKQVIASLSAIKSCSGCPDYNPFSDEPGYTDWSSKSLRFYMNGKIRSQGVMLECCQNLLGSSVSCGFSVPFMRVNSSIRFMFDRQNSHADSRYATIEEEDMLNRVRREVHSDLGLAGENWSVTGPGDVDAYLQWRQFWDHKLMVRGIDLNVRAGTLIPTGRRRDEDVSASIPFMGNGHWGVYGDAVCELELKQNWKLGVMLGLIHEFSNKEERRIPYHSEPTMFSAIKGNIEVDPGLTFKISPYFTLENFKDGMHAQIRYTYRKHSADTWRDLRLDKCVKSYLESERSGSKCVRASRNSLSSFTSHHVTFQVVYDPKEAMNNWWLKPKFYAMLDYATMGRGVSKTHQLTVGIELHPW